MCTTEIAAPSLASLLMAERMDTLLAIFPPLGAPEHLGVLSSSGSDLD